MPKRWTTIAFAALLMAAAGAGLAQQRDRDHDPRGGPYPPGPPVREMPRPPERWQPPMQPRPAPARMSEEERRQLRRDISDHGRDIYRDRERRDRR